MRLLVWLFIFYSLPILAHQSSVTSSQKKIKWNYPIIPIRIYNNSNTLPASAALIDQAIAEWNSASAFNIQRTTTGNNLIRFSSDFSIYGSAVIGVTEVNYSTSGVVNSATVLLNEENYNFTSTPGMPSGNSVYLKDVVTHELGHFVGLSHSEVLNSTMFYQNFPGQSELAADDKAGIRSKYDTGYGKIIGHVKGGNHIGILGVHVQAISRKSGEAIAGITDENGYFEISGLDLNDTYYVYTSNLKNLAALPSYFANVQTEFCPSSYVGSFFSQCGRENDGIAQGISLTPSQKEVDLGTISINCGLRIQEDYVDEKLQSTFEAIEIFNYALEPRMEKSYVGYFTPSELVTTDFTESDKFTVDLSGYATPINKYLKLRLISQVLGNAVEYSMTVKRQDAALTGPYEKTFNPEGTYKLDLVATTGLSNTVNNNVFEIEIQAKKLSSISASYSIPDFLNFGSSQNLPYLLVMSVETIVGPVMDTGVTLSDNDSWLDAPITYAVEKSTATTDEISSDAAQAVSAASCATIDPPSGPGSGPGQFLVLLSIGFFLSVLPSRLVKRGKKILS